MTTGRLRSWLTIAVALAGADHDGTVLQKHVKEGDPVHEAAGRVWWCWVSKLEVHCLKRHVSSWWVRVCNAALSITLSFLERRVGWMETPRVPQLCSKSSDRSVGRSVHLPRKLVNPQKKPTFGPSAILKASPSQTDLLFLGWLGSRS